MNPDYIIDLPGIDTQNAELWLYVDLQGLSYIILENNNFMLLAVYHFKEESSGEISAGRVRRIFNEQEILHQPFKKVHIVYGYPASVLVPHEYLNESVYKPMLELVYGDATETMIQVDFMYRHHLHNVYAVPKEIEQAAMRFFPYASQSHLYSLLPAVITGWGNHLYCIFHSSHLTVMLIKERKLQFIQGYAYKVPVDVTYHLLNLCKNFDVDPAEVNVHLNGLIDKSSALYDELHKYFLHLQFGTLPKKYEYPEQVNNYPEHFFSHLFQVSACV